MNSQRRISPGVGFGSVSMVVDDLDMVGASTRPYETDSPLIVDADAVLSCPITFERFQAIARRHRKVLESACVVEEAQLPQRNSLNQIGRASCRERVCQYV